jgi:hypothetical protein
MDQTMSNQCAGVAHRENKAELRTTTRVSSNGP